METTPNERRRHDPLPDELDGVVLEVESLHLTPEMRKKIPVLSHLPFYTDILFVELDLISHSQQRDQATIQEGI
jgi:hypothetical protein